MASKVQKRDNQKKHKNHIKSIAGKFKGDKKHWTQFVSAGILTFKTG